MRIASSLAAAAVVLVAVLPVLGQDGEGDEVAAATPPAPPTNLKAIDKPDDVGESVILTWELSPDDDAEVVPRRVLRYDIYRRQADDGSEFELVGDVTAQKTSETDSGATRGVEYIYHIVAVSPPSETHPDGLHSMPSGDSNSVTPTMQFFVTTKGWFGIIFLIVAGTVFFFIESARKGKDLKMRKIAGLEAVHEAVGRATEMGRPVLFIAGIQDINDIQTIAGITILGNVAKVCAEYDAKLEMPTSRALVMTTARETVENSFLAAGRPDAYNEDDIYYITDEQFGFVAGVTGTMVRKKPAACFYMGAFYAESLVLAETGHGIGAIQIAGTAMPSQLPFFVAACDYTLIGEEFFAASAYLSGEPHQLGSLKGQDMGKLIASVFIVVGCAVATLGALTGGGPFDALAEFMRSNVMGNGGFLP